MLRESVTRQEVVDFLNELAAIDPRAMRELCEAHTPCTDGMLDHPTVQVVEKIFASDGRRNGVGLLGVINGLFGIHRDPGGNLRGPFMIVTDAEDPKAVSFALTPGA